MTKNIIHSICVVAISYFSCNQLPGKQAQLWFYTHTVDGNATSDSILTPASFLYLQNDGSYTRDFGVFDYGHWMKKPNRLVLTNADKKTISIPIKYEDRNEIQLITGNTTASFEIQPSQLNSNQNDPFALVNNQWRVPPKHKETSQQLRKRLQNHCQFWETYFKWALDNELDNIDVRSSPTPIKIYGNGFTLKPYQDLPLEWRSCFYDSTDCQQANDIIKDIFEHRNITWAHTGNKYKMFISAFQQMEGFLR